MYHKRISENITINNIVMKTLFTFILSAIVLCLQAQNYTISGRIKDQSTGEVLIGASIQVLQSGKPVGTSTNEYGFYSLTLPKGVYLIKFSYGQYAEVTDSINLITNKTVNIPLSTRNQLNDVVIVDRRRESNISKAQMGVERLNVKEISKLPVIFGEKDVLKTLQLLPGVQSEGEGSSGFLVRGGAADQNLILLDEAPVYNASHLLGFFSTFNSDAIKDATLIKGNSPAQYGGRLSSVLDVKMNDGNNKDFKFAGGIGLISSRASIEGPIQKGRSSFLITARRTYVDMFLKLSPQYKDNSLYFYDINLKANYDINDKNRIYLSGYFGRDKLGLANTFGIDWGNSTGTIRWNSIINPKLFSNTSFIYSNYDYKINIQGSSTSFNINSRIRDINLKEDFQWYINTKNTLKFGVNVIHHGITPTRFEGDLSNDTLGTKSTRNSLESALYVTNTYSATNRLTIDYGVRLSNYNIIGNGTAYYIYTNDIKTDSVTLGNGSFGKSFLYLEPRLSFAYKLNNANSIKLAYSRNTQNLHLLSNSTSTNPTDQWIGNSYNINPEIADQVSVGFFRNLLNNKYELSAETYYKKMQNQIDYKNGADITTSADVESQLLYGIGRAYGLELSFKKKTGRFTGWLSYTLSKTERKIDGINNNNWYNATQDHTHDLSLVGTYTLNKRWTLSSIFVYYTGAAVTYPEGKYNVGGNTTFLYSTRNGYRMPAYNRLDFSATYEPQHKSKLHGSWNFSLYNVYGRENAYTITFEDDPNNPGMTKAVQTSLFRWVPSITYNFHF